MEDVVSDRLHDAMFETLKALGLNDREARVGAAGRDRQPPAGFDGVVERFRRLGLSAPAAKVAAIGRFDTESSARRGFDEAARPAAATHHVVVDGVRMTEAEYIRNGSRPQLVPVDSVSLMTGQPVRSWHPVAEARRIEERRQARQRSLLSNPRRAAVSESVELSEPAPALDAA